LPFGQAALTFFSYLLADNLPLPLFIGQVIMKSSFPAGKFTGQMDRTFLSPEYIQVCGS